MNIGPKTDELTIKKPKLGYKHKISAKKLINSKYQ